ncbi:hypothetical protein A7978_05740 (plasmid) [Borrelia turicatae]|uniref:Single-stranded DNA-binding protein n=1 Tax=Borrelia turicatae TaxID=142 RepID=A0A172XD09_BORTU|nr:single-stranded DNA-binding protein [Borrelia turicatae]ANF34540.1 hypothetical protein A7978_05740 [Borrelia turicatae]
MFDINSLNMSGRLTRDCELNYTSNSLSILKFTLANNRGVRRSSSWERQAQFFDCVIFGSKAESLAALLKRGVQVVLSGPSLMRVGMTSVQVRGRVNTVFW